tara:strand:- start:678 stop:1700 length:1023 start_codon:yes stop_codon:yes gene_type:complete
MSSLLEQAIIDANALREAAVKNAESAILDKYSTDIREAVETLLEQDDDLGDLTDAEQPADLKASEELSDAIPLAAASDSALEEQEIVIDFKDLKAMAEQLTDAEDSAEGGDPMGDQLPHPTGVTSDEVGSASMEVALEEGVDTNLEEDVEIGIDGLDELIEELVVDIVPQKSGWAGTPDPIMNYKEEMELARRSATEAKEQVKELTQAGERLSEQNEKLKAKNAKMLEALQILKENFNKTNLSNARLVYTNKVLADNSLNERQKNKIVEALSKSDSIEEAKVIFETLKGAVGSVTGKAHPQSLRETIERPSATLPRREARTESSPVTDRMQILAGIKTHK